MKRQATYAKLHGTDAFIPGLGGLGNTLPPTKSFKDFKMFWTGDCLYLEMIALTGVKYEAAVPAANVQVVCLVVEPTTK